MKLIEWIKKNKIATVIIVLLALLALGRETSKNTEPISEVDNTKSSEQTELKTEDGKGKITKKTNKDITLALSNGTFKVGKDLDEGTYILVKEDGEYMGNFDITTDTTGDMDSEVDSNAFENFEYVKVSKGEYIQLDKCTLYKPSEISLGNLADEKELTNGMFIVGKDIEAGEYKLEAINKEDGWYSLYNSLDGGYKKGVDLQDSDFFKGTKLITLKNGQYLKLDSNTKVIK